MGNLSNLYISQSFQSLIHLGTNNTASATLIGLEDGYGNPIGVSVNTAGDLSLSGSFTASLQNGYTYVGNSLGKTNAVATSSFASLINTGSFVTTSSFNAATGSFLTTGSLNSFQTVYGKLKFNLNGGENVGIELFDTGSDASGSMEFGVTAPGNPFIKLKKQTWFQIGPRDEMEYDSFTASFNNGIYVGEYNSKGRLGILATSGSLGIFGGNPAANRVMNNFSTTNTIAQTGTNLFFANTNEITTIISGSNNFFVNPQAPVAGFTRYIGGNGNIMLATTAIPFITSSYGFSPTMNNNIINGTSTIFMRAPVSSSTWNISNNYLAASLQFGTSTTNHAEKLISGVTATSNVLPGTVSVVANKTNLSASLSMTSNIIAGGAALNLDSSSVTFAANNINGNVTINNSYLPNTINSTSGLVAFAGNSVNGTLTAYYSGSNATFTGAPRSLQFNSNIGVSNIISASFNGDNSSLSSTSLLGQGLTIYANNSRITGSQAADWGSAFIGRWNDISANKAYSADSVFVVGTGTSTTNRRNGFLIDSGSNTYVEGTLNVSGSTSTTGSITIQSGSGDLYVHGHKQFNCGAWQDSTTQSGSANTAYAFKFDTVDVLDGVFLSGSTGLQAGAAGIYNIQWSGQLVQGASSADIIVWLRKNGVDVTNSGGTVTVPSNTKLLPAWNYFLEMNTNDVVELMWASTSNNTTWETIPPTLYAPGCASIIATVSQVR